MKKGLRKSEEKMEKRYSKIILAAISLIWMCFINVISITFAYPMPDTGQAKCYDNIEEIPCPNAGEPFYGQDASYSITPPSYTKFDAQGKELPDSADKWFMVRDNVTGLIWEVKQAKDGNTDYSNPHDSDNTYTWYDRNSETNGGDAGISGEGTDTEDFITAINSIKFGGFSDWRLPTIQELASIVNVGNLEPTINTEYFPYTASDFYWSSVTHTESKYNEYAWGVKFDVGEIYTGYKSYIHYVRCVRNGQSLSSDHLENNGNGTITDTNTDLMWQRQDADSDMNWEDAITYCETLSFAGCDDWRLPNREELRSIADFSQFDPVINNVFPNTVSFPYWSSTTYTKSTSIAWHVDFYYGYVNGDNKLNNHYVRCVRKDLVILEPRQASVWIVGDLMTIRWNTYNVQGNVKISVSREGAKDGTFESIDENTENDGSYEWIVTAPVSIKCVLKIEPLSDSSNGTTQGLFTITTGKVIKKAIIVAGGGNDVTNFLWNKTQLCADYAYNALLFQGYTQEDIYYLTPDTNNTNTGIEEHPVTHDKLRDVITQCAVDADELLIYMVDHGGDNAFRLNSTEIILADDPDQQQDDLNGYLDVLENSSCNRLIFIYDACESGSFLPRITSPKGKERFIIASSDVEKNAFFLKQGRLSFSYQFWAAVYEGADLNNAFRFARDMMNPYQTALVDADGDGVTTGKDVKLLSDIFIGEGNGNGQKAPVIKCICDNKLEQILVGETSATLCVSDIVDENAIDDVWAVITPPDYQPESPDIPIIYLPIVELKDPDNDGTYEGVYNNFTQKGIYKIAIYAVDSELFFSLPVNITVIQVLDGVIPGDIDDNGSIELKDAILTLKLLAGINENNINADADITGDGKIGMEEAIYILQKVSGLYQRRCIDED